MHFINIILMKVKQIACVIADFMLNNFVLILNTPLQVSVLNHENKEVQP